MGFWDDKTPKTRYRMLWAGAWRPVLNMIDAGNTPTTLPLRAVKAILYAEKQGDGNMVVVPVGPADIFDNPNYVTKKWDPVR